MKRNIIIPGKNIYPFSKENFDAVINHYFRRNGIILEGYDTIDTVFKKASEIELFEFEFILNCIIENLLIFENNLGHKNGLTISNLCQYGLDAFLYLEYQSPGSNARVRITNLFRETLIQSVIK